MPDRSHLSIGEVLSLLRDEFPDVTISKIRFLESQGLVDPERTPSGYRKFYEHDVERLRWILRQQRENFLPLKVIRGRLTEQGDADPDEQSVIDDDASPDVREAAPVGAARVAAAGADAPTAVARPAHGGGTGPGRAVPRVEPAAARTAAPSRSGAPTPSLFAGLHNRAAAPSPPEPPPQPAPAPPAPEPVYSDEPDTYSAEELAVSVGTEVAVIHELKQYGLIAPHAVVAGVQYFDAAALAVSRAAAEFARHGVESRHLRMWRNAADREADLFQQVVLPLLRQRNPQARRQALDTLSELSAAGAALRAALVERAVRDIR